jgi:TolA-binding protein
MAKLVFKILTYFALCLFSANLYSQILDTEVASTHLRFNLFSPKEQFVLDKRGNSLYIRTLNVEAFKNLSDELKAKPLPQKYISKVEFEEPKAEMNISTIKLDLASKGVEVFSFYRDRDSKYIIDFWIDEKEAAAAPAPVVEAPKPVATPKAVAKKAAPAPKKVEEKVAVVPKVEKTHRDFRYGASFIWDYDALIPTIDRVVNLKSKTPEHFYPIKDRDIKSDASKVEKEREAHLQLNINMYKAKKWGLMHKSIDLYYKKYGANRDFELNEFLKANAIVRSYLDGDGSETLKVAVNMYRTLLEKSPNYEFRRALYKYLIDYYIEEKEFITVLQMAKKFYVDSKENFDYEESAPAAEMMLFALVNLKQTESVVELIQDKTIESIIPKQKILAYLSSIELNNGRVDEAINVYEKNKTSFAKPVHASILYNTAEAYFRKSQYQKSIELFDEFLVHYSYLSESSHARLRLAISYDMLERDAGQVAELYRNAINRSQNNEISYEARIRYVGLRSVRKIKPDVSDKEIRVFLEQDRRRIAKVSNQMNELLWLTRLRTFINDGKFKDALSYLSVLQLEAMKPEIRRVFEADGAEIVYGLMVDHYQKAEYTELIKTWEIYKNKYISKIGNDPYMNFIVGNSALKLGLFNMFENHLASFKSLETAPLHIFPIWVERPEHNPNNKRVITELSLIKNIKLKNLDLAVKDIEALEKIDNKYLMISYYKATVDFERKNYASAIKLYEDYLARETARMIYDPMEIAELFRSYTDALYETKQLDKFIAVSDAVLNDTKNFGTNNVYMRTVREKIAYLTIEIKSSREMSLEERKQNQTQLESFIKEHPESNYLGRVKYLLGMSYVRADDLEAGKKHFDAMLGDKMIPEHIKELVKSELSLLKIREKTI